MKTNDILNLIKEIIEKTGAQNVSISTEEVASLGKEGIIWFSVSLSDPHIFLGRGGEGLASLNHIVKKIIESKMKSEENTPEFLVDINGFQKKKIESVKAIAHMMAERARYFKSNIEVDPMSAFERRIVHEFLSNEQDIKTESEGAGPNRRVVIKYIGSN